jgi:hypothetical protein
VRRTTSDALHSLRAEIEVIEAEARDYADELGKCRRILTQWAHAAGWEVPCGGALLHECLEQMRDAHCAERSLTDLAASGGIVGAP